MNDKHVGDIDDYVDDFDKSCESAISDMLYVERDSKMYLPEKKYYINLIDKLFNLGYYCNKNNDGEKASLFWRKS